MITPTLKPSRRQEGVGRTPTAADSADTATDGGGVAELSRGGGRGVVLAADHFRVFLFVLAEHVGHGHKGLKVRENSE